MISRLIVYKSEYLNPYINLAIEKHLLDTTEPDCLTLYLWQNQNTVVIGRNQNPWAECRCALLESEGGVIARRLSGGGAVFHDTGNLNFTFLLSSDNYDLQRQLKTIKTACSYAGIEAIVSGRNDILVDNKKFSGNAFYNAKGMSYHHGTILISSCREKIQRYLTPKKEKLESKGIKSVESRIINLSEINPSLTPETMAENMIKAAESVYDLPATYKSLIDEKEFLSLAEEYSSWDYIYGNTLSFSASCSAHFSWGDVDLRLNIRNGVIESTQLFTDSMDWTLPKLLDKALTGCKLEPEDIFNRLTSGLPKNQAKDIFGLLKVNLL